jgi:hypothetical protein
LDRNKAQQLNGTSAAEQSRTHPTHRHGLQQAHPQSQRHCCSAVLQSVFYVMVFVANTLAAHLFF